MCGIIGSTKKTINEKVITSLIHRGPDSHAIWQDESVCFGHTRLSIIDLSEIASQPMSSNDQNLTIVFNGEIYNFKELKNSLLEKGYTFRTQGDTEVILAGYQEYGRDFFSQMRGMWAFAIYDKRNKKIILSRDYFGIKPLVYSVSNSNFQFASEIKTLKEMLECCTPNTEMYYQFFNLGYFLAPSTYLKEISEVLPGEIIEWDLNLKKISSRDFINYPEEKIEGDIVSNLNETLRDSVEKHYISDVPVGILLSGGNDSSLIAAISKSLGKSPVCYHLSVKNSSDTYYAREVAKYLKLELNEFELSEKKLEEMYDQLFNFLDKPTADVSILPTSTIYSHIKGKTKVVLSGEGGDEFFGGYIRHKKLYSHTKIKSNSNFENIIDIYGSRTDQLSLKFFSPLIFRLKTGIYGLKNDLIGAYLKETKNINYPIDSKKIRQDLYNLYMTHPLKSKLPPSLFYDLWMYLPNNLMYKNDISSMYSSIEARVPLLDKEIYKVVANIPEKYLLSEIAQSKFMLKSVMEKYLPHKLIYRDKKGFGFSMKKYSTDLFTRELEEAINFHVEHADLFGISHSKLLELLKGENIPIFINKYPRFAFSLITNYKLLR